MKFEVRYKWVGDPRVAETQLLADGHFMGNLVYGPQTFDAFRCLMERGQEDMPHTVLFIDETEPGEGAAPTFPTGDDFPYDNCASCKERFPVATLTPLSHVGDDRIAHWDLFCERCARWADSLKQPPKPIHEAAADEKMPHGHELCHGCQKSFPWTAFSMETRYDEKGAMHPYHLCPQCVRFSAPTHIDLRSSDSVRASKPPHEAAAGVPPEEWAKVPPEFRKDKSTAETGLWDYLRYLSTRITALEAEKTRLGRHGTQLGGLRQRYEGFVETVAHELEAQEKRIAALEGGPPDDTTGCMVHGEPASLRAELTCTCPPDAQKPPTVDATGADGGPEAEKQQGASEDFVRCPRCLRGPVAVQWPLELQECVDCGERVCNSCWFGFVRGRALCTECTTKVVANVSRETDLKRDDKDT